MRSITWMVVVTVFAVVVLEAAADVTGRWRAEFQGPGGTVGTEILDLSVKNGVVTGTFTNAVGGVGPVRDGKWDGTTLRFWVPWDGNDRLEAAGKLIGPNLDMDLRTGQWKARRLFRRVP